MFFVARQTLCSPQNFRHKIAILRRWRKIGLFMFLSQKKFDDLLIFVDEGIFHSAHNFLISPYSGASKIDIEKFLNHCPQPHCLITLNSDTASIINKSRNRERLFAQTKH